MEKKEISLKNEEILLTKDMYNERRGLLDKEWVSIREYHQKVFAIAQRLVDAQLPIMPPQQNI